MRVVWVLSRHCVAGCEPQKFGVCAADLGLESPSYEQDQPRPPSKPAPRVHSSPCLCGAVRTPKRSTQLTPPLHAQNKAARSALIRAQARAQARARARARARVATSRLRGFAASRLRVRSNTPQLPSAKQPRPSYSKNQRQQHVQIPTTDEAAKNRVRVRVRETRTSTPTHSSLSASISCANPAPAIIRANPCSSVAEKNPWLKNHPLIPVCSDRRRYLMRLTRLQQHSMVTHARRFYANHPRPLVITEIRHPTTLVNPRIPDHRRQ